MDIASAIGFAETHAPLQVILMRLLMAAIMGGIIGFEREARNREAGLRTHILIAVAACLFTILAFEIYELALAGGSNNPDPIRAVEAVTAGIAFLGAGAIFTHRANVHGLTTGAGMWLAGAVGIACALGYYLIAFAASILAVVVLAVLHALEDRVRPRTKKSPEAPEPPDER